MFNDFTERLNKMFFYMIYLKLNFEYLEFIIYVINFDFRK